MSDCGNSDYEKIELSNYTDLDAATLFKAEIVSIDPENNNAELLYSGSCPDILSLDLTEVEFWYHCEDSSGTIEDLANGYKAFADEEEVYILYVPATGNLDVRLYIVGHVDIKGTNTCAVTEYLRLWVYNRYGSYDVIFDLGKGAPLDMDSFVGLSGSPTNPTSNPSLRDTAWLAWFAYNFEYSDEGITVPILASKVSTDTSNIPNSGASLTTISSDITPMGSACTQTASVVKKSTSSVDSNTYYEENIYQSGTFNTNCPSQLASQTNSTSFDLFSASYNADVTIEKGFGFGYDIYDTSENTFEGEVRFTFQEKTIVTVNEHSSSYPYVFVEQSKDYTYGVNVFNKYSYTDSESSSWVWTFIDPTNGYEASGIFADPTTLFGSSSTLWTASHAEGERFFVFIGGTYQQFRMFYMEDCGTNVGCNNSGCWNVYVGGNYSSFGNMYSVLAPASYWIGVCEYVYDLEYKIFPSAIVTKYSDVPDLILGETASVGDLINNSNASISSSLSSCVANLIETAQTGLASHYPNFYSVGPSGVKLCKLKEE